ncbi:MAG: GTP 3',8-cyclase MoaA, partial [Candidatus Accumulibacter sp.]|nr:GTP 3',8-cyclase MoaA [Accumulibacter sp.]
MFVSVPPVDTLLDALRRPLRGLRISVTDRCNLRCAYCMPREAFGRDFVFLRHADLLSFEEIVRVARQAVALGVRKIRLSGGEPLLRRGIERLVEMLAGLRDETGRPIELAMTSNGVLLSKKARALKDAGLARLNVSLDALDETVFQRICGSDAPLAAVLEGINAAQAAGFAPLKVNAVIKRAVNESEILPLVRHFRHTGVILRFIEFMDVGTTNGWRLDNVAPADEILARIDQEFPLRPLAPRHAGEVGKRWQFIDGGGEIGVIASVTQTFCHECDRLRLSTDGKLYTCLFASDGADLRTPLRAGE